MGATNPARPPPAPSAPTRSGDGPQPGARLRRARHRHIEIGLWFKDEELIDYGRGVDPSILELTAFARMESERRTPTHTSRCVARG